MKALSIKQPWANMIASGEKTIETRMWSTKHRGPLLIVSSKEPDIPPAGFALAVVDLIDCRPMSVLDEAKARCSKYDGAYSWVFGSLCAIEPFPVRGLPSIFDVDDKLVERQLQLMAESDQTGGSA